MIYHSPTTLKMTNTPTLRQRKQIFTTAVQTPKQIQEQGVTTKYMTGPGIVKNWLLSKYYLMKFSCSVDLLLLYPQQQCSKISIYKSKYFLTWKSDINKSVKK